MVKLITLGCKVNQYESEKISSSLREAGISVVEEMPKDFQGGIYIINTCSVTSFAEKKSRYQVSKVFRDDAKAKVIVCGCASELNKEQFPEGVEIFGTDKSGVIELVRKIAPKGESGKPKQKKRINMKVQDGCNNFCNFCIIPHLRGRERSRPIEEIISEIKGMNPVPKEIVLTGINLSAFKPSVIELCEEIGKLGIPFRLSSIYPETVTEEFCSRASKIETFRALFHISLQSGCDKVLKEMNRQYSSYQYSESVKLIRRHFENPEISTDIIVGYPTETEEDFLETIEFVKQIGFNKVHVFPFSAREGTPAAKLKPLPASIVTARAEALIKLTESLAKDS